MQERESQKLVLKIVEEKFQVIYNQQPIPDFGLFIGYMRMMLGDLTGFYSYLDKAIEAKSTLVLQMYGDEFCKPVWYDEHVIASRKKFGLPVFDLPTVA